MLMRALPASLPARIAAPVRAYHRSGFDARRTTWAAATPRGADRRAHVVACRSMAGMDTAGLVSSIHATATKLVLYVTGGGSKAISELLSMSGASNTVLEASVPYATPALTQLLGRPPTSFCSEATATSMARVAYRRAAALSGTASDPVIGLGCTAALRSVDLKRGEHRVYVACHTGAYTHTYSLTLEKGARSRGEEEDVAASLVLAAASLHCSHADSAPGEHVLDVPWILPSEEVKSGKGHAVGDPIAALLDGRIESVEYRGGRVLIDAPRPDTVLLSGSFNPLHDGHTGMLEAACLRAGRPPTAGVYELSVSNADKGMLSHEEIKRRVKQFTDSGQPLVLTRAAIFTAKAALFRSTRFVLGFDTAARIVMPKYYNNSEANMVLEFARLQALGGSFTVAGRFDSAAGRFLTLADIDVPECLASMHLFVGLSEDEFRMDVSSTEIRRASECGAL